MIDLIVYTLTGIATVITGIIMLRITDEEIWWHSVCVLSIVVYSQLLYLACGAIFGIH